MEAGVLLFALCFAYVALPSLCVGLSRQRAHSDNHASPEEQGVQPQSSSRSGGEVPFRSQLTSWEWLLVDATPCCGRRETQALDPFFYVTDT